MQSELGRNAKSRERARTVVNEDEISRLIDFSDLSGEDPIGFGVSLEGRIVDGELGGV